MKFSKPQHKAKLVKRYKRFLADVLLEDGTEMTVHCANSGAMTACNESGRPVIISDSQNPKRKLQYTWEMIQMGRTWVGVNTATPNQAVAEFIQAGEIPELLGYESLKREVKYGREGKSRIDILLTRGDEACYVEIKNATTISQTIGFTNPLKDSAKVSVFVETVSVRPKKAIVPVERGLKIIPSTVKIKIASICIAWMETPLGGLRFQIKIPIKEIRESVSIFFVRSLAIQFLSCVS